jgi:hypothetical protein
MKQRRYHKHRVAACVMQALAFGIFCVWSVGAQPAQVDPLPSWNNSPARSAITDFVGRVTKPGGPARALSWFFRGRHV